MYNDGFFSIFNEKSYFSLGSKDIVTVTVFWQWNTSFFIGDVGNTPIEPNPSTDTNGEYLPYYQIAYDEYYGEGGLNVKCIAASKQVDDFIANHSPEQLKDNRAEIIHLLSKESEAIDACNTSLLVAYDDYDTLAANALTARREMPGATNEAVFRIKGAPM